VRLLSGALGFGTILFGALPALFPQRFGRLFGVDAADNPTVATAMHTARH
jgi:hypothetical protein